MSELFLSALVYLAICLLAGFSGGYCAGRLAALRPMRRLTRAAEDHAARRSLELFAGAMLAEMAQARDAMADRVVKLEEDMLAIYERAEADRKEPFKDGKN